MGFLGIKNCSYKSRYNKIGSENSLQAISASNLAHIKSINIWTGINIDCITVDFKSLIYVAEADSICYFR